MSQSETTSPRGHTMLGRVKSNSNGSIRCYKNSNRRTPPPEAKDYFSKMSPVLNSIRKTLSRTKSVTSDIGKALSGLVKTEKSPQGDGDDVDEEYIWNGPENSIDRYLVKKQIAKAKAEGKTVSFIDGKIYIDYKLLGPIPEGLSENGIS